MRTNLPAKPPRYDRLSFYYYSSRLRAELAGPIWHRVEICHEDVLAGAQLQGVWIALKADRNGGGFIAGASSFATTDQLEEDIVPSGISLIGSATEAAQSSLSYPCIFSAAMQTGYLLSLLDREFCSVDQFQKLAPVEREKILRDSSKTALPLKVDEHPAEHTIYDSRNSLIRSIREIMDIVINSLDATVEEDWKNRVVELVSHEMLDAYEGASWEQGYAGQLAADRVNTSPESFRSIRREMRGAQFAPMSHLVRPSTHPRDVVMKDRMVATIASRKIVSCCQSISNDYNSDGAARQEAPSLVCLADEKLGPLTCRFQADIDFTARLMLETVQERNPGKFVALSLVPVSEKKKGSALAVLALLLVMEKTVASKIFPVMGSNVSKLNEYPHAETVKGWAGSLQKLSRDVARTLPLLESIDALSEVFSSGEKAIGNAVSEFDIDEMQGREEDSFINSVEQPILRRLLERKVQAAQSAISHPLDAFCSDILGFMREALTLFDWASLVDPLQRFAQQERLLLGTHEHRDHYLHTLKVYLLGRRLFIRAEKYGGGGVYDDFFRERWTLASLLHDTCYPIQKAEDWLDEYIQRLVHKGVSGEISTRPFMESWKGKAFEQCWFDALLRLVDHRLSVWLSTGPNGKPPRRFQAAVLFSLLEERNHAVLGAMSLLMGACHEYPELSGPLDDILDVQSRAWRKASERNSRIAALFDAATAIILHDPNVWDALTANSEAVHFSPGAELDPEERAVAELSWLLAVSDVIQEWGRDLDLGAEVRRDEQDDYLWRIPAQVTISECDAPLRIELIYRPDFENRVVALAKLAFQEIRECMRDAGLEPSELICSSACEISEDEVRPSCSTEANRTWPTKVRRFSTWQSLSIIASAWDLLGGKTSTDSFLWFRSLSRFLHPDKRRLVQRFLKEGMKGNLNLLNGWSRERFAQQFTSALRRRKENSNSLVSKSEMANFRRMHGFWRIPYLATRFWRSPGDELSMVVTRAVDGVQEVQCIDVLTFSPLPSTGFSHK